MNGYNKEYINIYPKNTSGDKIELFKNCVQQLNVFISENNILVSRILKLSIFIENDSNREYLINRNNILNYSKVFFKNDLPAISIIGQIPSDNTKISVEVMLIKSMSEHYSITHKLFNNIPYILIKSNNSFEIIAAGVSAYQLEKSIHEQSEKAFQIMQSILLKEKLNYNNVIRQWNYIERILKKDNVNNKIVQNYQIFNDVRAKNYDTNNFKTGYPAATGIGVNTGGVIIDFMALSDNETEIIPINNPKQKNAYQYSQDVLMGEGIINVHKKYAPKFERAVATIKKNKVSIYISGTASIIGEKTIGINDIEVQTKTSIENILQLLNNSTLKSKGFQNNSIKVFSNIRVYYSEEEHIDKIKNICNSYFENSPIQFLIADICRNELLVEIEASITI